MFASFQMQLELARETLNIIFRSEDGEKVVLLRAAVRKKESPRILK